MTSKSVRRAPALPPRRTRSYEAEAAVNSERNGARNGGCSGCSGRRKMGYIGTDAHSRGGTLRFNRVYAGRSGTATVTIVYLNGESRDRWSAVAVNGRHLGWLRCSPSGGWNKVRAVSVKLTLQAGNNTILFSNPHGSAPDLDRIIVSTHG